MSLQVFTIKRGDTSPGLQVQLLDGDQPAQGLATASGVKLILRRYGSSTPVVSASMTVADQTLRQGWVSRPWQSADTAQAGDLRGEVEVTWGDGSVQTFPADSYFTVNVIDDLG